MAPANLAMQESTPIKMKQEGPPAPKKIWKPVKGVDIPEDLVLSDGTVLDADIDWDAYAEKEFGKGFGGDSGEGEL